MPPSTRRRSRPTGKACKRPPPRASWPRGQALARPPDLRRRLHLTREWRWRIQTRVWCCFESASECSSCRAPEIIRWVSGWPECSEGALVLPQAQARSSHAVGPKPTPKSQGDLSRPIAVLDQILLLRALSERALELGG